MTQPPQFRSFLDLVAECPSPDDVEILDGGILGLMHLREDLETLVALDSELDNTSGGSL